VMSMVCASPFSTSTTHEVVLEQIPQALEARHRLVRRLGAPPLRSGFLHRRLGALPPGSASGGSTSTGPAAVGQGAASLPGASRRAAEIRPGTRQAAVGPHFARASGLTLRSGMVKLWLLPHRQLPRGVFRKHCALLLLLVLVLLLLLLLLLRAGNSC